MPGDLETNGSSVRAFLNPNEEKIYRHKKKCGEKSLKSIVQIRMCPFFNIKFYFFVFLNKILKISLLNFLMPI